MNQATPNSSTTTNLVLLAVSSGTHIYFRLLGLVNNMYLIFVILAEASRFPFCTQQLGILVDTLHCRDRGSCLCLPNLGRTYL